MLTILVPRLPFSILFPILVPSMFPTFTILMPLHPYPNRLTSLPNSLGNITSLQWLECSFNPLTSLPIGLLNIDRLVINITNTLIERQYGSLLAYKQQVLGTARSRLPASA